MGALLVTPPSVEPITLADAKLHLRVIDASEDSLIGVFIAAARQHVEEYTQRRLINQTWSVTFDGFTMPAACVYGSVAANWLELPFAPASSITGVTYVDGNGVTQTLAPATYSLDAGSSIPRLLNLGAWPSTKQTSNAVAATVVFGYGATPEDVPAAIRAAMLLLLGNWYANREAVVDSRAATELPMGVAALLAPYRVALGV